MKQVLKELICINILPRCTDCWCWCSSNFLQGMKIAPKKSASGKVTW